MNLSHLAALKRLRTMLRDEDGQAMVEYSLTTILLLGTLAVGVSWPFTRDLFTSLQSYIDLYFYALNLAIG
jgi:Flp pilus assembly pilin Flp